MADFPIRVTLDVGASYAEFRKGIAQLENMINGNPPKIKLQLDTSSLGKDIKGNFSQMMESIRASAESSTSSLKELSGVVTEISQKSLGLNLNITDSLSSKEAVAQYIEHVRDYARELREAYDAFTKVTSTSTWKNNVGMDMNREIVAISENANNYERVLESLESRLNRTSTFAGAERIAKDTMQYWDQVMPVLQKAQEIGIITKEATFGVFPSVPEQSVNSASAFAQILSLIQANSQGASQGIRDVADASNAVADSANRAAEATQGQNATSAAQLSEESSKLGALNEQYAEHAATVQQAVSAELQKSTASTQVTGALEEESNATANASAAMDQHAESAMAAEAQLKALADASTQAHRLLDGNMNAEGQPSYEQLRTVLETIDTVLEECGGDASLLEGALNNAGANGASALQALKTATSSLKQELVSTGNDGAVSFEQFNRTLASMTTMQASADKLGAGVTGSESYQNLIAQITAFKAILQQCTTDGANFGNVMSNAGANVVQMFELAKTAMAGLRREMADAKNSQRALTEGTTEFNNALVKTKAGADKVNNALIKFSAAKTGKGSAQYQQLEELSKEYTTLENKLRSGALTQEEFNNKISDLNARSTSAISEIKAMGEAHKTLGDRIKSVTDRFSSWFGMTRIIMYAIRAIRQAVQASIALDSAFTNLKIVTGASDEQLEQFKGTAIDMAKALGQNVTDVSKSIETFSRLGYTLPDASELARYAQIMANVANVSADDATTGITSIIKGFDMDVQDVSHVADVLVNVGQKYAVSAGEMMEAYEKSGAALNATNTSFEKSAGLIAAANAAIQNASTVGTALKTISARIRGSKTELEELGEDTSDLADSFSKYAAEIKALTGVNIMVEGTTDQFKDLYDIMSEIAGVWDTLKPTQQARTAEILGGTRQLQVIASILGNFGDAAKAYDTAQNSAGAATKANEIYMESTQAHINQMKASFQELASTLLSSDFLKTFVDLAASLLEILNTVSKLINTFGGLKTALLATAGIIAIVKAESIVAWLDKAIHGVMSLGKTISTMATTFANSFMAAKASGMSATSSIAAGFKSVTASVSSAQIAVGAFIATLAACIIVVNKVKDAEREAQQRQQEIYDAAMSSISESKNVNNLYQEYKNAKRALDESASSKEALETATRNLADALGLEGQAIDEVSGKLDELASKEKTKSIYDAKTAIAAAEDTLVGLADGIDGVLTRDKRFDYSHPDFHLKSRSEQAEILIDYYNQLIEERDAYIDSGDTESAAYEVLVKQINGMTEAVNRLISARNILNELEDSTGDNTYNTDSNNSAIGYDRRYLETIAGIAKTTREKLGSLWDSDGFSDTKKKIQELANAVDGISANQIDQLAESSEELASILEIDGINAKFLANILQTQVDGGDGFALITEDALILNQALEGMTSRFADITEAQKKYNDALSVSEKDTEFRSMADAFSKLNEQFEKGTTNSNTFWAAAEYLFGSDQLDAWGWEEGLERIYEAAKKNVDVFSDADSAGAGFLDRLNEIAENGQVTLDDGTIIAQIQKLADGSYDFDIDGLHLPELAEQMDMSEEAVLSCLKALSMWGDVDYYDMQEVLEAVKEIGLSTDEFNGTAVNVGLLTDQLITLGYSNKEIRDIINGLRDMDNITLVDVNSSVETLVGNLNSLGIASGDGSNVKINVDGLATLASDLNLTKEDAEMLISKLGEANGITLTDANGQVLTLNEALDKLSSKKFASVTSSLDHVRSSASNAKNMVEDLQRKINLLTGKTVTITVNEVRRSGILEESASKAGKFASGTRDAPSGDAVVGEEGEELILHRGAAYLAGSNGAEVVNLDKGDTVYTAAETRKILRTKRISGIIPAYKNGKASGTIGFSGWGSLTGSGSGSSGKTSGSSGSGKSGSSSSASSAAKSETEKAETWFEKLYKEHKHLLEMNQEDMEAYLRWLDDAYKKAYSEGIIELDDYRKYQEEVYHGLQDLFKDYLDDVEHEIDMRGNYDFEKKKILSLYKNLIKSLESEIAAARARGLDDNDDYIQELQKRWMDYTNNIKEIQEELLDAAKDAVEDLVDYRIKMIKQDVDNDKDALDKKLDNLKEFYDKQKELLQQSYDEDNYLAEQAEKRREVANIRSEMGQLQFDNSAWAQRRMLELQEQLTEAEKSLRDFERKHALDSAIEFLDNAYDNQEKQINAEIDALEETLNDPEALYNRALTEIRENTSLLYSQMLEYNRRYGSGNDDEVKEIYEEAYKALQEFHAANDAWYKNIQLMNSTGYVPNVSWNSAPVSGYASGTSSAAHGLHRYEELGPEYTFVSANGNKYRVFSGGEKVLNAKATDFLYRFANNGKEILGKIVRNYIGDDSIGKIRPSIFSNEIRMGDITINGNADHSTVSEIRRAQREAMENMLRELSRLQKA